MRFWKVPATNAVHLPPHNIKPWLICLHTSTNPLRKDKSADNTFKCENIIKRYVDISNISIWSIEIHKKTKVTPIFISTRIGLGLRLKNINWIKLKRDMRRLKKKRDESSWGAEWSFPFFPGRKKHAKRDFF